MRLPTDSQLSREQKEVCFAPTERSLLVKGPPGSGKTVVAVFRRNALVKQNRPVVTLAYNHVLKAYTGIDSTFYAWLANWWRSATRTRFPMSYGENGAAYDFEAAAAQVAGESRASVAASGHWGHLVLDEAQDFDRMAHAFLSIAARVPFHDLPIGQRPSIAILADENQRLTASNSTISDIVGAHMIPDDDVYELRRNYRNTLEIARLSAHFYTGLQTGVPELPGRRGNRPTISITRNLADAADRIAGYARLHEDRDIGVLVMYDKTRRALHEALAERLLGSSIAVQTYTSRKSDPHADATKLQFDGGGRVTILCYASGKGLEFDTVFLPELQTLQAGDEQALTTRMNLYVMSSRAREELFLSVSDSERGNPIWRLLPVDSDFLDWDDGMPKRSAVSPPEGGAKERPILKTVATDDLDAAVDVVMQCAKQHGGRSMAVLSDQDRLRKRFFNKLQFRLAGAAARVELDPPPSKIDPAPGSVCIAPFATRAGKRFDIVFLPELQAVADLSEKDASTAIAQGEGRARVQVVALVSGASTRHPIWRLLKEAGTATPKSGRAP